MSRSYYDRHRETLNQAMAAVRSRGYWSAYPEMPGSRNYGEQADEHGRRAFEALHGTRFRLDQPGTVAEVVEQPSPYGMPLDVVYPRADPDVLLPAMLEAMPAWRDAGPEVRAGICLEILARLNKRSFEIAHAVMHTTGQGFMMAFQAGGPHAQDRGLEAVAYACEAMSIVPASAHWEKPQGRHDPLVMEKTFHIVPRGIALAIACSTFPTWNSYPGMFASLVCGNPVVVKPHPGAILPLAITVQVAQEVLAEAGFAPHLVALATDTRDDPIAHVLAVRPEVRLVDFTGSPAFGNWLEENARQAVVFTEKAGVNSVVIDSTDDFRGMIRNLAFSLSLYSGQMCTSPQNIYVPRDGITSDEGHKSVDEVASALAAGVTRLLADPERAAEILGAIQSEDTVTRLVHATMMLGGPVLASEIRGHPRFPEARVRTPLILKLDAADEEKYMQECFGPVSFLIESESTGHGLELARRSAAERGALTWSVYSTDDTVLAAAEQAAMEACVALSCNLAGGVFVNQSAAFSDYHGTGGNPAANACLTDAAFVACRFRVVQSRRHP